VLSWLCPVHEMGCSVTEPGVLMPVLSRRAWTIVCFVGTVFVNALMSKENDGVHRRTANELQQGVGINRFEIAFERARRNAELAQHETGKPAVPAAQTQPSAGPAPAVAHHVDMHVDSLHGARD